MCAASSAEVDASFEASTFVNRFVPRGKFASRAAHIAFWLVIALGSNDPKAI